MTTAADHIMNARRDLDGLDALILVDLDKPPIATHRAVKIRVHELTRAGHRPASFSTGPGGGDSILPSFDRADQTILGLDREYRQALATMARAAQQARRSADKILARARVKKIETDETKTTDDVWCSSCLKVGAFEPRADPRRVPADCTLCLWCFKFEKIHGFPPPVELLKVRVEKQAMGQRVTEADLVAAGVTTMPTRCEGADGASVDDDAIPSRPRVTVPPASPESAP